MKTWSIVLLDLIYPYLKTMSDSSIDISVSESSDLKSSGDSENGSSGLEMSDDSSDNGMLSIIEKLGNIGDDDTDDVTEESKDLSEYLASPPFSAESDDTSEEIAKTFKTFASTSSEEEIEEPIKSKRQAKPKKREAVIKKAIKPKKERKAIISGSSEETSEEARLLSNEPIVNVSPGETDFQRLIIAVVSRTVALEYPNYENKAVLVQCYVNRILYGSTYIRQIERKLDRISKIAQF